MTSAIEQAKQTELTHFVSLHELAPHADAAAQSAAFADYASRRSQNTLTAHRTDLQTFAEYLAAAGAQLDAADLQTMPQAWAGLTFGIVEGFARWMLREGYAVSSVNRKLSTVKTYAKLAAKAGALDGEAQRLISTVSGYSAKEGKRVDEKRAEADTPTRLGNKKANHVSLTPDHAYHLKRNLDDTEQAVRDDVLMSLLLDLGLRVGELAALTVEGVNLGEGLVTFYRPKVDMLQTHALSRDAADALREYFGRGLAPKHGRLLRASRRSGKLTDQGMTERGITKRVRTLGAALGIANLSAHDCRHYWATHAAREGTDAFALRDAGGWSSMAMPGRYVEGAKIANARVKL